MNLHLPEPRQPASTACKPWPTISLTPCPAQDRGEAPADPGYDKAMQGLRMLAKQNARISLSALLSWRKDVIEAVKVDPNASAAISLRKRVSSPLKLFMQLGQAWCLLWVDLTSQ